MRLWVDVFDADGVKLGTAYDVIEASVDKALDASGTIDLSFPSSSEQTASLITQERRVQIWIEQDEKTRLLGAGVTREFYVEAGESGMITTASGPDSMDELTRKSVLRNRSYTAQTIETITSDLLSLVTGWEAMPETGLGSLTCAFDGSSVLKALVRLADETGLHIRLGDSPRTLEIGVFGTDSGVTAVQPGTIFTELNEADDILLISNIGRKTNSKDVINWIIPLGADTGDGDFLTLEDSTGSEVQTITGNNGETLYYLSDDDSIELYGQIEKVVSFDEVTDADALYEAARAWLALNSLPLVTYTIDAVKCRTDLQPGDLLPVKYQGIVQTETGNFPYLEVNETFWIVKVSENISDEGISLSLDVASVPRYEIDTTEILVGALEKISVRVVNANTNIGYIKIQEQQNSGTDGGTFTSGAWTARGLNTIVNNENSHASLSSNQITLDAGEYEYNAWAVAVSVNFHQLRLYNVTEATEVDIGGTSVANSVNSVTTHAFVNGKFTIEDTTVFELQHQCTTTKATNGLGAAGSMGTETYAMIEFDKKS